MSLENAPAEVTAAYIAATAKQRALAEHLAKGLFKADAMRAAGYSESQSKKCDIKVTEHPLVLTLSRWYFSQAIKKVEVSVDRVVEEMADIALFDPILMYDDEGKMLPLQKWPAAARRAFAGFDSNGVPKLVSKTDATEKLAKLLGWNAPEKHVHDVNPLVALMEAVQGAALPVVHKDPDAE